MHRKIATLVSELPIPQNWSFPEVFHETVFVGDLPIYIVGMSSRNEARSLAVGAAGSPWGCSLDRAYFELLERIAVIEASNARDVEFPRFSIDRRPEGTVSYRSLFPQSEAPAQWRYALSNGVALQKDWTLGCVSAASEIIERDLLLRSWLGEIPIREESARLLRSADALEGVVKLQVFTLPTSTVQGLPSDVHVAIVMGEPAEADRPVLYGFGAALSLEAAAGKAETEFLQRLAFLWDEPRDTDVPIFTPTSDYHQEVFLRKQGSEWLKAWLGNAFYKGTAANAPARHDIRFIDITPPHFPTGVSVVKATCDTTLPLIFGRCRLAPFKDLPEDLLIHPVA